MSKQLSEINSYSYLQQIYDMLIVKFIVVIVCAHALSGATGLTTGLTTGLLSRSVVHVCGL